VLLCRSWRCFFLPFTASIRLVVPGFQGANIYYDAQALVRPEPGGNCAILTVLLCAAFGLLSSSSFPFHPYFYSSGRCCVPVNFAICWCTTRLW
jgi:hypothetical protein